MFIFINQTICIKLMPELQSGIWGLGIFDNEGEERIEAAKAFIRYIIKSDALYTRAVLASSYWSVQDFPYTN